MEEKEKRGKNIKTVKKSLPYLDISIIFKFFFGGGVNIFRDSPPPPISLFCPPPSPSFFLTTPLYSIFSSLNWIRFFLNPGPFFYFQSHELWARKGRIGRVIMHPLPGKPHGKNIIFLVFLFSIRLFFFLLVKGRGGGHSRNVLFEYFWNHIDIIPLSEMWFWCRTLCWGAWNGPSTTTEN